MERKKSIIPVIVILSAILFVIFWATYFYHKTVFIDTPYKVSDIVWHGGYGWEAKEHRVHTRLFVHSANYGIYYCDFNLHVDDKVIPVHVGTFKCNNWEHEDCRIQIRKGSTESEISVIVYSDGFENLTDHFDIRETDRIDLCGGP
jgi:hypothetical protein